MQPLFPRDNELSLFHAVSDTRRADAFTFRTAMVRIPLINNAASRGERRSVSGDNTS